MTRVAAPAGPEDWAGFVAMAAGAFAVTRAEQAEWFAGSDDAERLVRVATEDGRVVAGGLAYVMEQRFGGRAVRAGAVGDVCVAADRRGRGLAQGVLRALDLAMREAGVVVSPLWPSTLRLYRRTGWEVAGTSQRWTVEGARLERLRGAGHAVPDPGTDFRAAHAPALEPYDGPLHRPDWWWGWRWPEPAPEDEAGMGWMQDGRPTGLMRVAREPEPPVGRRRALVVTELWVSTPAALAGLLGMLGAESAHFPDVRFTWFAVPPVPDVLWALPELPAHGTAAGPWMLRLVDPAAALAARGWPAGAEACVELEVHDPLHETRERLVVEVGDGRAGVSAGGAGRVRIGAGGLAAWYAGGLSATRAARVGLAEGPDADLRALDALTGDRPVWLSERF